MAAATGTITRSETGGTGGVCRFTCGACSDAPSVVAVGDWPHHEFVGITVSRP